MPLKGQAKRDYQNNRSRKAREEWIISQGSRCAKCGETELPFEVDHVDPATKFTHRIWAWSKIRRNAELAKCQLLCKPCHHEKTGKENSGWTHGESGYQRKCRCIICVEAHNEAKRQYRQRKRDAGLSYK